MNHHHITAIRNFTSLPTGLSTNTKLNTDLRSELVRDASILKRVENIVSPYPTTRCGGDS